MSRAVGTGLAAVAFALVGYLCLARTRYLQGRMVRFVGVVASVNALIAVWVLFRLSVR